MEKSIFAPFLPLSPQLLIFYATVNIISNTNISKCLLVIVLFVESEEENAEANKKRRRFKLFFYILIITALLIFVNFEPSKYLL